jgi:excisionase family DNA binding protein
LIQPAPSIDPASLKPFLRPDELTDIFNVSLSSVYRRINDNTLDSVRFGRLRLVTRESVIRLLPPFQP